MNWIEFEMFSAITNYLINKLLTLSNHRIKTVMQKVYKLNFLIQISNKYIG